MTCQQRCNARLPTHTDGAENGKSTTGSRLMNERKETLSNSNDPCRVTTTCVNDLRVQESVLRQGERRERSEQNTVKGAVSRTP